MSLTTSISHCLRGLATAAALSLLATGFGTAATSSGLARPSGHLAGVAGAAYGEAFTPTTHRAAVGNASCKVVAWASTVNQGTVQGYQTNGALCGTISAGPYHYGSQTYFIQYANGLATSRTHLYVADKAGRIFVFSHPYLPSPTFVKVWSTSIGSTTYNPWSVCVNASDTIVGVGNYQSSGSANPVAEFFKTTLPNGSSPSHRATSPDLVSQAWCAFDVVGNFFVDGTTALGAPEIDYVATARVHTNTILKNSFIGSAEYWYSMYSRIDSPVDDTLSVVGRALGCCTQTIYNWKVAGPPLGPLTFTTQLPFVLTGYPSSPSSPIYQVAPALAINLLYIAAFYNNELVQAPANGGSVTPWTPQHNPLGVAAVLPGQY